MKKTTTNNYERIRRLALQDVTAEDHVRAKKILSEKKVAIFVVAYNAELHLRSVIARISEEYLPLYAEIFIIDDSSSDSTFDVAREIQSESPYGNINIYRTPYNRGYGGNQKIGFLYSVKREYDFVILLHGDGQYAPEYLPKILAAFEEDTDAVFASRMINKQMALHGGMPLYKWVGNQILTRIENFLLGTSFSEFHTGFRAYRCSALKKIPFQFNSNRFHFDTEIIIQAVASGWKFAEVSIPTFYGDEVCNVNGIKYAINCIQSVIKYHLTNIGLYYERNFDFDLFNTHNYQFKQSKNSLHQHVLNEVKQSPLGREHSSIELGANHGLLSSYIAERVGRHVAVDITKPTLAGKAVAVAMDLDSPFSATFGHKKYDCCFSLDVIEHMKQPEDFLQEVFNLMKPNGTFYLSTANIAFLPMRLSLSLGLFNYGKRGILDRTHKRLFTVNSLLKVLRQYGFAIEKVEGFAPPLTDLVSKNRAMRLLESVSTLLAKRLPNLFSYNFLVVATRMDDIEDIFKSTMRSGGKYEFDEVSFKAVGE